VPAEIVEPAEPGPAPVIALEEPEAGLAAENDEADLVGIGDDPGIHVDHVIAAEKGLVLASLDSDAEEPGDLPDDLSLLPSSRHVMTSHCPTLPPGAAGPRIAGALRP